MIWRLSPSFFESRRIRTKPCSENTCLNLLKREIKDVLIPCGYIFANIVFAAPTSVLASPTYPKKILYLQLSKEEQDAYDKILSTAKRALDDIVSSADKTKQDKNEKVTVLFTALTGLRRLCDLGTLPPIQSSPCDPGQPTEDADMLCELCSLQDADESLLLKDHQFCPECSQPLHSKRSASKTGYLTPASLSGTVSDRAMSPLILSMDNGQSTKLLKVRDNVLQALQAQRGIKQ